MLQQPGLNRRMAVKNGHYLGAAVTPEPDDTCPHRHMINYSLP